MKRILGRIAIGLLATLGVVYASDWAVWRTRVAMGGGMDTVNVGMMIETPLKGNKMEFDWGGYADVDCSKSLFPQAGSGACWWLERHKIIYEK